MARRSASLKPHLNQIRTWVAEGVTDIWIAHQLDSTPASIAAFRRRHGLTRPPADGVNPAVAAAGLATAAPLAGEDEDALEVAEEPEAREESDEPEVREESEETESETADGEDGTPTRRRRRGRRGGRGRRRRRTATAALSIDGDDLVVRLTGLTPESRAAWDARAEVIVEVDDTTIALRIPDEGDAEA